jgi:hypothetical protein
MSSYNNYEGIEAAYTPGHVNDIRGRLFFKMAFDGTNPVLRASPDKLATAGFFNNNDPRWEDAATSAQELTEFKQDSAYALGVGFAPVMGPMIPGAPALPAPVQHIANSIQKVKRNSNAVLRRKMLSLFDLVYTFTIGGRPVQAEQVTTAAGLNVVVINAAANLAAVAGVAPGGPRHGANIFNFHPAKLTYRMLHGSTGSSNNEDLVAQIVGTVAGVGDKSVKLKDDGEWKIKNDAGDWEDLRTYMNRQPVCKVVGQQVPGRTADQCNDFTSCVGQENHKNILGANGGTLNVVCFDTVLDNANWKFVGAGADEDALKKIDPAVAFWILKGLCFKGVQDDEGVVTVESTAEWFRKLNANEIVDDNGNRVDVDVLINGLALGVGVRAPATIKARILAVRAEFTKFCELLVAYVNTNDDILNGTKRNNVHGLADSYGLRAAVGVKMDPACKLNGFKSTLNGSLNLMNFRVGSLVRGLNLLPLSMIGGHGSPSLTQHVIRSGDKLPVMERFSGKLRSIYTSLLQRLNNMGKDLNQTTRDSIDKVFKSVQNSENEILKVLQYLNRFAEVAKHDKNLLKKKGDVSFAELEKAYKTYNTRMGKLRDRGVKLVDILRTLLNGTNEIEDNNVNLHMSA